MGSLGRTSRTSPSVMPQLARVVAGMCPTISLFGLVNLICEIMISEPKHVNSLYESLPEKDRKAIEKRDAPKAKT
jgi:hypothetical protein